ncbi:phosphatidate cytidylyltransferase, mitochondrial-like [Mya arenaria]|uniref:phosphatidate cytidylyltransferase, mitochondrial-like n=1 Tax=Mya arenaria TaxID=6604 RepID=UPI0022E74051|nr:phosphatidate cytidylyltransferase, mitochondrial-like [Mya arenaria]XP_052775412.1 phosphatidate cytidylyltransferase, mitochondrial-like [Mya arenaria]
MLSYSSMSLLKNFRVGLTMVRCLTTSTQVSQTDVFQRVMNTFPNGVQMAFAYGSGVFQQQGGDMSKNMLDFIMIVDNPHQWHSENLAVNNKHYSFLRHLGAKGICNIQNNFGAGVYFNTLVPFEERMIKYGVIGTEKLISDLVNWETLYVSGRLHKPVKMVKKPTSFQLITALDSNLCSALHTSLLLLPETFTEVELFTMITGLSYSGDFRMTFGEDKGKVLKIVTPNMEQFKQLYHPIIEKNNYIHYNKHISKFVNLHNEVTRFDNLNSLPRCVVQGLLKHQHNPNMYPDTEEVIRKLAKDTNIAEYVAKSVAGIVNKSSWSQSVKSVLTAGFTKSIKYSYSKVKKMVRGMRKVEK